MMRFLAAEGDTWGIPGPTFLWIYAVIAVVAIAGVVLWRRRFTTGPADAGDRTLTPTEVAFLNGDRELAVYSSLAALRAAGAVEIHDGQLEQHGPLPVGAPELDRAVYAAAGRRVRRGRHVQEDPTVAGVLDRVEEQLADQGWLLPSATRSRLRLGALAGVALFGFGFVRMVAGSSNGRPIGYLLLLMALVAVATLVLLGVPRQTSAARALLGRLRTGSSHLRPNQSPSWQTYGPAGAALGVGLFGAAAIWAADPAFAADAEIRRQAVAGSSTGGSCSGGDSGGGSGGGGCGGGGCGG